MATIAEIRQQYPQYEDMTDQQLGDALYSKFYSDMPRAEFDAKVGLASPGNVAQPSSAYEEALASGSKASQMFGQPTGPNLLDRGQSFAQGVIEGLPVVGPTLANARTELDALIAQIPGGMTPDEVRAKAAERKAFLQQHAGNERLAGEIAGAVVPLTAAGMAAPAIGTALGMTGGLGAQVGLGGLSSALISGADALADGGSLEDAGKAAIFGGAVGAGAPIIMKGAGAAFNALTGRGVDKGASTVGRALADDVIEPSAINAELAARGPGATVMDLGPNLQAQAGALAAVPGPAQKVVRSVVTERAKDASTRVAADLARNVGPAPQLGALTEQIVAAQKAAADPLYAAVRDIPLELEGNIKFVASTPLGKSAFEKAAQLAANDGNAGQGMTVGFVDYVKRSLDDIAGAAKRSGENNAARQASQMTKLLTNAVDAKVPGYKAARDAFAGPAAVLDAIEEGQSAFARDLSPDSMEAMLKGMTTSEKDAYLQGAKQALADLIGNSTNDVRTVRDLLRRPYHQAKLRMLIGDQETTDLLNAVDRELIFGQTSNVVAGNSETARRAAAMGEVAPDVGGKSRPIGWLDGALMAFDKARAVLTNARQGKVNRQMAELLTATQLTPGQIAQLSRAMKTPTASPVAPAALPQIVGPGGEDKPTPLRIVVDGAGSYFEGAR